MKKTKLKVHY